MTKKTPCGETSAGLWELNRTKRPVVLSYGLGVDSTAILLRWLNDPTSRRFADGTTFDLNDLIVITAMTGDEWESTGTLVEDHILPLLRKHNVHYVQVARSGYSAKDGITVLDSSTHPRRLHLAGDYALAEELLESAIVPQIANGLRHCSEKQKAAVIERMLHDVLPPGEYINVIGFDALELRRAQKATGFDAPGKRESKFPLIEWNWDRQKSVAFIHEQLGVHWLKSACVYCPFAWRTAGSRLKDPTARRDAMVSANGELFERYATSQRAVVLTLALEYGARCVNPSQTLRESGAVLDIFKMHGGFEEAIAEFYALIDDTPHRNMDIRRVKRSAKRGDVYRSIHTQDVGTKSDMRALLETRYPRQVVSDGVTDRVWHRFVPDRKLPAWAEHANVLVPQWVKDKRNPVFEARWLEVTGERLSLPPIGSAGALPVGLFALG